MHVLKAAALALLALPAAALAQDSSSGEEKLAKLLDGRVAGKPVQCVNLATLGSSEIIDGTAIVYRTAGSRIYVNRPRGNARDLDNDHILVTKTSGSQLCNIDSVDLVDRGSRTWTGFVRLGDFVPYDRVKTAR